MSKILFISEGIVDKKMAGPGMRYLEMSKYLSKFHSVILACPNKSSLKNENFEIVFYTKNSLKKIIALVDIIIIPCSLAAKYSFLWKLKKQHIVIDLFDSINVENLEFFKYENLKKRIFLHNYDLLKIKNSLLLGDFFICANEKQKDYWTGMLMALNKINPLTVKKNMIDIVSSGISKEEPKHKIKVLKGIYSGINENDKVIIWGGGIWNWLDPITLINAMNLIVQKNKNIKMFFMGISKINSEIPQMQICLSAIKLSKDLNLYNKYVFFNEDWVLYEERQNYLLEADIGISLHYDTLETEYSSRTRILDYIWCNLPIICTEGDIMAKYVEKYQLGKVVKYQDVDNLVETILMVLNSSQHNVYKENIKNIKKMFLRDTQLENLKKYCDDPYKISNEPKRRLKISKILFMNLVWLRIKDIVQKKGEICKKLKLKILN
ncbi:MAG: glycosyltransferase [bacterium]